MYYIRYKTRAGEFVREKPTQEEIDNYRRFLSPLGGITVIETFNDEDKHENENEFPGKKEITEKKESKITWGAPPKLKKGDKRKQTKLI